MAKKRTRKKKAKFKKLRLDQIGIIGALSLLLLFYPGDNIYAYPRNVASKAIINSDPLPEFSLSPYPRRLRRFTHPEISARAVYIFDSESGTVLFEKGSSIKLPPASITKLLTAIVALENYPLNKILSVRDLVTEGKTMGLFYGERISVENLLYGALVHSANDAAYVLAQNFPGGVEAFVAQMNNKAKEIGLLNSRFANPVGFDDSNQYITARDLAVLSQYVLGNPVLAHMVGTKSITVADDSFRYFHYLKNVNELLGEIPGVGGVKTGFTAAAGENLASLVKKENRSVIVVVLKSKDRFGETRSLVDWVFREFRWEETTHTAVD